MAYDSYKKDGEVVTAIRVVGLSVEKLWQAEVARDISRVSADDCSPVEFWRTRRLSGNLWLPARTCLVPVDAVHKRLAFRVFQHLHALLHTLGLSVIAAVLPKTKTEGRGHHDIVLKHGGSARYCDGFMSAEIKVGEVSSSGGAFENYWRCLKRDAQAPMEQILKHASKRYGACLLIFVGVCDGKALARRESPLLVRVQVATVSGSGSFEWGRVLVDRPGSQTQPASPATKRRKVCSDWAAIQVELEMHQHTVEGIACVPLARLFMALASPCKSPGQKMGTYKKTCSLTEGVDFFRVRLPANSRGPCPYWVSWDAAKKIVHYETGV